MDGSTADARLGVHDRGNASKNVDENKLKKFESCKLSVPKKVGLDKLRCPEKVGLDKSRMPATGATAAEPADAESSDEQWLVASRRA